VSVARAIGSGTRALLIALAVGVVAALMLGASSGPAKPEVVAPAPITIAPPEVIASYPAFGYRQGIRQTIEVVTVGTSPVELTTARAFFAMRDAALVDGITLTIESGFRTHAEQAVLYSAWRRGKGNRAARPGESNHQSGRALDISVREDSTYAWLSANASRFGFTRTVANEPWHWEYVNTPRARSATTVKKVSKKKKKTSSGRGVHARTRRVAR
jgi:LAS superfamily LD-carboxypeptidase LdcB